MTEQRPGQGATQDSSVSEFPPFMTTRVAARYCGFKNAQGLHAAFRRGKVRPWGKRGGTGAYVWRREDLDEFLRGGAMGAEDGPVGELAPSDAPPGTWPGADDGRRRLPRQARGGSLLPSVRRPGAKGRAQANADALERVRQIAARGRAD